MVEGISHHRPAPWHTLARILAGFFPVGVFALVLLWAMSEWGVTLGVIAGTLLGALAACGATRLIAAYPLLRWFAAAVIGILLLLAVLSFL